MPVREQLNIIYQLLQAGREIPVEDVIEIVPDVGTGLTPVTGTTEVVQLGNGIASEVSQVVVVDSTATEVSATTAGVGFLAMDVGAVGLALAPTLGILAGIGLYNLAPEFWTNVSNALVEAGQTIGGKVRLYFNGDTKTVGISEEALEIYKDAFINAGLFDVDYTLNGADVIEGTPIPAGYGVNYHISDSPLIKSNFNYEIMAQISSGTARCTLFNTNGDTSVRCICASLSNFNANKIEKLSSGNIRTTALDIFNATVNGVRVYYANFNFGLPSGIETTNPAITTIDILTSANLSYLAYVLANGIIEGGEWLQPDATYPDERPIPQIYPEWNPWSVPVEGFPARVFPIEIPELKPEPDQEQAQHPIEFPDDNPDLLPWFIETLPQPQPDPDPRPEPEPQPDPDPRPDPDPMENPSEPDTDPNPPNPNPDPSLPPLPVVPDMPDTVESNAMFTVYKPSMAQVNSFGGWLWSSSIVEAIKRIWQNPLDGIISFMKVYVDAPTSGSDTIKVGILDSEVSSPVVSGQFVTVECGSLNVREKFYNATDYSPFVGMHLYLPFIGIVELDIDEFMSGEIKVTYHIDVYTGTCLAEVKSRRSPDMPEWTIVYTFSGNASQQLPLTSAEFSGALSSLVGVVGGGLAIASGGGLGLLAGASGIAHAVSHEMVHLAHSGSLSANAGIMGSRKPYLILTRRRSYDANGYNELYGYPSNKTVYLNNCSGYVKVKDIRLETVATDSERIEIESLLKAGVII